MQLPLVTVEFDDGFSIEVQAKARDLARAEVMGHDITECGPQETMYAATLAALGRMQRNGEIPEERDLPSTVAEFMDAADVDVVEEVDEDAEGKGSGQAAPIG